MQEKKEKKLPPGITLRKDGRYMWRFNYDGQQYSGYTKNLPDAKQQLRDKRYEVEHGLHSKEQNICFDAWFQEWLDVYKTAVCKASTLNFYRNTYGRYIKPVFGKRKIKALKPEQIQRFTNEMAQKYSKATASTINFLMFDSLKQAARNGIITRNPMENTTPPKFKSQEKGKALSADQEHTFLEATKSSRYYPLYRAASLSGMRIGEVLGLSWLDVDFDREEIRITHTLCYTSEKGLYLDTPKSKASKRTIPMHRSDELFRLLKNQFIFQKGERLKAGQYWTPLRGMKDLVFTTGTGTPYYDMNIRSHMRKVIREMQKKDPGLPDFTFHTLRHCFATRCIEAGMDPKALQAILGHSTFAMTMDLYCDVMESTKHKEMRKVQGAL